MESNLSNIIPTQRSTVVKPKDATDPIMQEFFVSPSGNDSNSGNQSYPFLTITRAQQAVRNLTATMTGDIIITLAGGMYQLTAGLMFNQSDSGQNGYQVIYRNAVGETAIISGGVPIMNWTLGTNGIWSAPSPVSDFRQLYVNGQRAVRGSG